MPRPWPPPQMSGAAAGLADGGAGPLTMSEVLGIIGVPLSERRTSFERRADLRSPLAIVLRYAVPPIEKTREPERRPWKDWRDIVEERVG